MMVLRSRMRLFIRPRAAARGRLLCSQLVYRKRRRRLKSVTKFVLGEDERFHEAPSKPPITSARFWPV